MIGLLRSLGLTCPVLPVLLIVCLAPAIASAQSLRFRNETTGPVIVQPASVVQGVVRPGPRITLNPNNESLPVVLPGNKIVTVYDPRVPGRVLYQGTIPASTADLHFAIVPDQPPPRVKLEPRTGKP